MITPSFNITATERVLPKLALDFTTDSLDSRITFTRALNTATRINSMGNIEVVNVDMPRFDFDPITLACKGLLIEESRTNSNRNSTAQGAVAGTPGTAPTNWQLSSTASGLTRTIIGTGTENGIEYIDVKYAGTASALVTVSINFESGTQIAASSGQTWTNSCYVRLIDGTLNNFPLIITMGERTAAGANSGVTTAAISPTNASLITQRYSVTRTFVSGTTAYARGGIQANVNSGTSIDVTLRVGLPQTELGAFATSVIKTTNAAVTRNADVATMTGANFSDWFNATNGASDIWLIPKSTSTLAYMSFDDNTANNKIVIANNTMSGQSTITSGGVLQATLTAGTITANATNKVGCSWNTNNCAATANATTPATTTSATIPTVTQLRIGNNGTAYANAWIQKLFYWPQRITNNEIQAFTK